MVSKVKVGVIGCGNISRKRHIAEYAANPNVELVAFCDPVRERAEIYAGLHGGEVYTDYRDLLQQEGIDAVSVCTPNVYHASISVVALRAGKHVLCEKPMATSVKEANEMIQAAKENGVHLMIGHNQRLIPAHVKAKQILKQGYLGKVISFRTTFAHGGPERWSVEGKNGWFFQKAKAFVGAMGDLGVHKADLIRWLLDDEVVQVAAFVETLHKEGTDVDDNATCLLRMKCGAIGTLTASWTHYGSEDNSTILSCENGTLKIGADPQYPVAVDLLTGETERYTVGAISTNTNQLSSGVIDAFIQCILSGTSPSISGEEGLKSLNVILACLESAEKNTFVSL